MRLFARLGAIACDDSGQSLLEYGMLAALIALVTILAITSTGSSIGGFWTGIATSLTSVA